ncbi:MAG: peptide chain release factor N(5)-glutamine methyltransferase [Deltaproteobacteria bacterium]|nr:peptide chain release factor N(5)-glutamine methyltransferase [Deltaproteobacteria bacterium]
MEHKPTDNPDATWTVGRVLAWTREEFQRRGVDNPRLDAEVLLAHALSTTRLKLYLELDKPLGPAELAAYRALVKRRAAREPVSHVVGAREFWGRAFRVTADTLAPRPETETLVEEVLAWQRARPAAPAPAVLDVGTGTGCLAITLALEIPGAVVTAVDVSAAALAVAQHNAEALHATVRLLQSDVVTALAPDDTFDVVVSNPPYVTESEWAAAEPEVRDHEPRLALVGSGADGLGFHRRLLAEVFPRVRPGGLLLAEIGHQQEEAARALWSAAGQVDVVKDLERRDRAVRVRR